MFYNNFFKFPLRYTDLSLLYVTTVRNYSKIIFIKVLKINRRISDLPMHEKV